jgi:5-methylcytosine-specific restriction endonuclease McrA
LFRWRKHLFRPLSLALSLCLLLLHGYVEQARSAVSFPSPPAKVSSRLHPAKQAGEFKRKDWPHWVDADHDCQDTRAEILIRDSLGPIKFKRNKPCNVSWGLWTCPYTGKEFYKASDLDIDHIVPLAHAFRTGGAAWPRAKKRDFANDPLNLVAVDAAANRAKGDQGPDLWRPPRREFWPEYARRWREVKKKYGLSVSSAEDAALRDMTSYMGRALAKR